jgi:competence ComEA-like helix-hairpin-helix protein
MLLTGFIYLVLAANEQGLPAGKGQEIVQQNCSGCHVLKVVTSKRASKQQWSALVDQMISRGAEVPDEEIETVVDYLAKNFGATAGEKDPDRSSPINVNKSTADELAGALGLSAKEAAAIVAYREQNGNFKVWRDLINVPGIETEKIESHKDRLAF